MKTILKTLSHASLATILLTVSITADDISDTLEEALASYKKGDVSQTKEDVIYVLELLKQKNGNTLKEHLPPALDGWEAEEAKSETAGAGMLGGGTVLSRSYKKDKSKIVIEIITDSPLLQGLGSMFANPMFNSGGEIKRINREKATVKYNKKRESGEIVLMLDKRFVINVKGTNVSKEVLIEYAEAIDFKALKKM
ncbi:MAG: Unknown protein [uncultured Sulfurovum sp.]|uniref:Uncharacterized protein n=1 Tax=uncultured Sulfurovum sp. TaxID=269237 RepID=A0A6S6SC31_9BACT|nr:MAG: Unknown protein [uncultured Sulfurovum sp.]